MGTTAGQIADNFCAQARYFVTLAFVLCTQNGRSCYFGRKQHNGFDTLCLPDTFRVQKQVFVILGGSRSQGVPRILPDITQGQARLSKIHEWKPRWSRNRLGWGGSLRWMPPRCLSGAFHQQRSPLPHPHLPLYPRIPTPHTPENVDLHSTWGSCSAAAPQQLPRVGCKSTFSGVLGGWGSWGIGWGGVILAILVYRGGWGIGL